MFCFIFQKGKRWTGKSQGISDFETVTKPEMK